MAYGGGSFVTQNKTLPGTYMNFVSVAAASSNISDRGVATMGLELDWGIEGKIFEVTSEDFQKDSLKLFGYSFSHEKLKGLRDLFKNIKTLYAYRLNGGGTKATNKYATAVFGGTRGNDIKIVIQANAEAPESDFDVITMIDTVTVDKQVVKASTELKPNDFVTFKEFEIGLEAGMNLSTGTNTEVNGSSHQTYLDKAESYNFNVIGLASTDDEIKSLYVAYTKRMREEIGAKFQCVLYNKAADYEGIINVKNQCTELEPALVYWTTGAQAGCPVNKTLLNRKYDGEYTVNTDYTQNDLVKAIKAGEFTFHNVNGEPRVLEDINSLVSETEEKGPDFKSNQTIRVIDQVANDIAVLFNSKYLGNMPNDAAGRTALWADIVKHHEGLQNLRAIEDFSDKDVVVELGSDKKSVYVTDSIKVTSAMAKLYMVVRVA